MISDSTISDACILAILASNSKEKPLSQTQLAKILNMSQQSVSRKLKELENMNLIRRVVLKEGEIISLTEEGERYLNSCLQLIMNAIMNIHSLKIRGRVTSGLGEGKIFLSIPYYTENIKKTLGFVPYPGTLNIVIYEKVFLENRLILDTAKYLYIPEHKEQDRILGSVKLYPATINGISPAAVVIPTRTTHPKSVVEVISPYHLREKLNLKDGDEVEVEVLI